ncbi:PspC domain-containing protein [Paenibacillus marinisediminis]
MNTKLYRSRHDSKLTGLCGGIGQWMGIDVTVLRVLFILGVFFTGFTLLIPYFIIALVVPKEPLAPYGFHYGNGFGPGHYDQNQYHF